ncbi:MAG: hypothetical protein HONBIEJF_01015 [Fimbriimonadaceae bacterium]|nr:hypothetical protein [Fimbriimonadaceae bacterium]
MTGTPRDCLKRPAELTPVLVTGSGSLPSMSEGFDKIPISTPVERPEQLLPEDRDFLHQEPGYGELIIQEINPWRVPLADPALAAKVDAAQQAIRSGDRTSAEAWAREVEASAPGYCFNQTILIEAIGLRAGASPKTMIPLRLEAIGSLQRQLAGLEAMPPTIRPIPDHGLRFELARHYYNLGDDFHDLALDGGGRDAFLRAATFFRLSRSLTDAKAYPANYLVRLLREAVVRLEGDEVQEADRLLAKALYINSGFTRSYLDRSDAYAHLKDRIQNHLGQKS